VGRKTLSQPINHKKV